MDVCVRKYRFIVLLTTVSGWVQCFLFGTKFVKLYNGPMWRVETTGQDHQALSTSKLIEVINAHITLFNHVYR